MPHIAADHAKSILQRPKVIPNVKPNEIGHNLVLQAPFPLFVIKTSFTIFKRIVIFIINNYYHRANENEYILNFYLNYNYFLLIISLIVSEFDFSSRVTVFTS